ncbi:MAG: flotillin family protein [Akkermansia sp.]
MPEVITAIIVVLVVIVIMLGLLFATRYKKCPSDKIMVIYGSGLPRNPDGTRKSAICIHGGAKLVYPFVQGYQYLDLTPMSIQVDLKNALSRQNIRIDVPSRFTVGISTEVGVMQNAAERLLGLRMNEVQELAKDIIFGQLRLVIATMDIEEINTDRDKFLAAVSSNVETELKKIGLRLINVNVTDINDESGYIDALGKLREFKNSGIMTSPADLYCAGKPPVNWYGSSPRMVDEELYKKVETYLDNKKITTKQAWINKYNTVSEIGDEGITQGNIAAFLHEYMYRHNQLRRKRDPFPTPVEFFAYLVDKYENCSKLRDVDRKRVEWTGVSLEGTPWPAMMALSETRPLRECDSVWERYMGHRGPTRLWLYGPYRMDDDKEPPILFSFDPDPEWSRESNERKLHEGGVCGTMSLISRNSQIARGIPAAPAGQPGHGNLMTTNFGGNGCWLA